MRNFTRYLSTTRTVNHRDNRKKVHWAELIHRQSNVTRALSHFDDFYATVFGSKWPSLRLALLSPPKYMAIPNSFTGELGRIGTYLEDLGGFNIVSIWSQNYTRLSKERKNLDIQKDLVQLSELDRALEAIAVTKQAEELDTLYKNVPRQKMPIEEAALVSRNSRVLPDIKHAQSEFIAASKLKGLEEFDLDSEYYAGLVRNSENWNKDKLFKFTKPSHGMTLKFPPSIIPYTFVPGSAEKFPSANRSSSGLREFICINGASIAPILALNLQPELSMLDMCAGPGTKTLLSLMTFCLDTLTCNDTEINRLNRVTRLLSEFLPNDMNTIGSKIQYTNLNAAKYPAIQQYDRVLADVPCLQDRVSCTMADNSIFKTTRTKERINLPKIQSQILLSAFRALTRIQGSTCVYSTCSLSPVENDGVVMAALRETEVPHLHIDLIGLWNILSPLQHAGLFYLSRTKFGVLIEPNISSNFGPMFVSRIVFLPPKGFVDDTEPVSPSEDSTDAQHAETEVSVKP